MKPSGFKIKELISQKERESAISPIDFKHTLCIGDTGSGKTASLILPTLQDRITKGHAIIFFDHKSHEHKKVKLLAEKAGRLEDVIELGKPQSHYINLLAELDIDRLKEIIREGGMSRDPYWPNSAANLVEDILIPLRKLHDILLRLKGYELFQSRYVKNIHALLEFGIDVHEPVTFKSLSKIIASPKHLIDFREMLKSVPEELSKLLQLYKSRKLPNKTFIYAKILQLKASIVASERFIVSESKSDANSGNNAVLQTLDNTIASYAKRHYMNHNDMSILELMNTNAIIVIDTQSFAEDIMKVFFESMMKKAVRRLGSGTVTPLSVFIDEANRVLSPNIDLHNDVLREAGVEVVLAIQNEEQMIHKFSDVGWKMIKKNIRHQYAIDASHRILYNNNENYIKVEPLLFEEDVLAASEFSFYALAQNRKNLQKHFLGDIAHLPENFKIIYNLDIFEMEGSVIVKDEKGVTSSFSYFGEDIIEDAKEVHPLPLEITEIDEELSEDIVFEYNPLSDSNSDLDDDGYEEDPFYWDEDFDPKVDF